MTFGQGRMECATKVCPIIGEMHNHDSLSVFHLKSSECTKVYSHPY
jgi:hypothetical protein